MGKYGYPSIRQKLGDNAQRMRRCIVVKRILGPTFLKLRQNAMNSTDQSLNHLFRPASLGVLGVSVNSIVI
jgi:hypothetical protein